MKIPKSLKLMNHSCMPCYKHYQLKIVERMRSDNPGSIISIIPSVCESCIELYRKKSRDSEASGPMHIFC